MSHNPGMRIFPRPSTSRAPRGTVTLVPTPAPRVPRVTAVWARTRRARATSITVTPVIATGVVSGAAGEVRWAVTFQRTAAAAAGVAAAGSPVWSSRDRVARTLEPAISVAVNAATSPRRPTAAGDMRDTSVRNDDGPAPSTVLPDRPSSTPSWSRRRDHGGAVPLRDPDLLVQLCPEGLGPLQRAVAADQP